MGGEKLIIMNKKLSGGLESDQRPRHYECIAFLLLYETLSGHRVVFLTIEVRIAVSDLVAPFSFRGADVVDFILFP